LLQDHLNIYFSEYFKYLTCEFWKNLIQDKHCPIQLRGHYNYSSSLMGLIGCYEAFHRASAQLKIELCSLVHTLHFLSSDLVFATRIKSEILKLEISKFVDNEKERRDGRSWYSIIERKTA